MRRILGKFAVLAIGMSLAAFLCGFCSAHDWVPATCEEPETCSICGETRGNPLGHQWGKLKRDLFEMPEIDEYFSRTCEICDAVLHPIESGRWTYLVLDDGTAEIVSVRAYNEEIIIPTYIDGIKVTTIGEQMLFMDYGASDVVIPEGVTTIGEDAFAFCDGAYRINIPSSVTTIIGNPFWDRGGKTITVSPDNPNFEIIDGVLFDKNEKRIIYRPDWGDASSYTVPEGTLEIGPRVFSSVYVCSGLKEIILPSSLKKIDDYAFEGCCVLERIDIPEGVTSIGYQILPDYGNLETITVPSSVSEMNGNPFKGKRVEVILSADNPYFEIVDGVLFDKNHGSLVAYLYDTGEESYVIPDGITEISAGAFSGCGWLKQITIPESVTVIGAEAFQDCRNLEKIVIPEGVTELGDGTFFQCENLKTVSLPSSLKKIGKNAFLGCVSLEEITIPQGVTVIDDGAFQSCNNLSCVSLPVGLMKIGGMAFSRTAIERIDIPQGVKYIGNGAFFCSDLKRVSLPEGLTSIGRYTFSDCDIEEITVPESVTFIGYGAFFFDGVKRVTLPGSFETIDKEIFNGTGLNEIVISDGVTTIGDEAFAGFRIKKISIPGSVTEFGYGICAGCSELSSVSLSEGITEIGEAMFKGCTSLKKIEIPEGVTRIRRNAFSGCSNLETVRLPESLAVIEDGAFSECENLKEITLPSGLEEIGVNPFSCTPVEITIKGHNQRFEVVDGVLIDNHQKQFASQFSDLLKSFMSQQDNPASTASEDNGDLPVANIENASALSAYLPKAIRAREQTLQCSHLDEETINRYSRGILLDWDNDGMEELFLTYYHPKSWYDIQKVCCYDIEDGKVKAMIEDMQSEVVDATGMRGFSGITMYQGKPAVFSCAFHEYTSEMSDRKYQTVWAKFTLWDLYSKETLHKVDISCDGHHLSYKIDGKPCTESDFISIIDDCSFLTYDPSPREPYMTYSLSFIPIDELIELLGGNTSAPSAKENIQAKQLSQIKRITSNGDESIITFQYDSNGRLISSTGSDDNVYTYSYDDAGHLIEVNCSYWEPYGPMYEYHYDENGFLVEVSGIGEGGGIAYTLENDAQGRVIRKTRNYDFGTAVTEYVYSDNGAHVEEVTTDTHSVGTVYQGKSTPQETTVKTASVDYTYDDRGRVLSETRTSDGKAVRTTYDYSYPPLIFVCDENGTPYRCEIRDSAGIQIWYMVIGKGSHSIERDDDGYLSGMICDDADYQFRFSCEENPDWSLARDLFDDVETKDRYHDNTTKDTSEVQYVVGYVVNAESGLNVRQNPSTSSERVRRIHNGTRVLISEQVTIDGMLWGRISDGWICMNYIKLEEEESTRGVRYVVSPSAGVVNIRCEAGTAYESIERIVSGEEVIIYSQKIVDGREWGKTDAGWICMEYLTRSP